MPNGFGSISREPNSRGYFEIRVSLAKDASGKRRRVMKYAKTRAEATNVLRTIQRLYGLDIGQANQPMPTLADYLESWIARKSVELSAKSVRSYRSGIENLVPALGHLRLDQLRPDHIARALGAIETRVVADLRERELAHVRKRAEAPERKPRKNAAAIVEPVKRGYSGSRTAQAAYDTLRAALNFAVNRDRLLTHSPLGAVPRARVDRSIAFLSREEARALLDAVSEDRYRAMFHLFIAIGLRWSEAAGLRWRDVDLVAGHVSIARAMSEQRVAGRTKTAGSRRRVDLPASVIRELGAHRDRAKSAKPDDLVFVSTAGTALHASNFERRTFFPALVRAEVRRIRIHDLRHTCATLLLQAGVNPKVVAEILGHASIRTTLDTYSHAIPTLGKDAARQYDRTMFGDQTSADEQ